MPVKESQDEIPSVIFIPEKTYLCRWETGCDSDNGTFDDSTELLLDDSSGQHFPGSPRAPTRTFTPPPGAVLPCIGKAKKHMEVSKQSGIDVGSIHLQPVEFHGNDNKRITLASAMPLSNIISSNNGNNAVTVVFCIRRPGCGSCRDHGLELSKLTLDFNNVNLFGIVKDNVDHIPGGSAEKNARLLTDFYTKYFPFPLCKDKDWESFQFLGNRQFPVWKLFAEAPRLTARYQRKKIENVPFGGDLFTQGGVLLFDATGQLRYVYYERYGDELDMKALRWAIRDISDGGNQGLRTSDTSPPRLPTRDSSQELGSKSPSAPPRRPMRRRTLKKQTESKDTAAPKKPRRLGSNVR